MSVFRARQHNVPGGRSVRFEVKTTPEEAARLHGLATDRGVTVPRLLVSSTFERGQVPRVTHAQLEEMFAVGRYLGAVGRTVNQIAKVANATGEIEEECAATLAAVRAAAVRLSAAIEAVTEQ